MSQEALLPVRKVAEATGIPAATLRVWERRYGRPMPVRTPSGQRRYCDADVRMLRRVAEGLRAGLRPRALLSASPEELEALVSDRRSHPVAPPEIDPWMDAVLALRDRALHEAVLRGAEGRPLSEFLDDLVGPFLEELGTAWANGRAEVRHEHLASTVLADALAQLRSERARPADARDGRFLLATLPGEQHGLGLAMVAAVLAEQGVPFRTLGPDLPLVEIAGAAREVGAATVAVSVSLAHAGLSADRSLSELYELLPVGTELWVGGRGARRRRRGPHHVRVFTSLTGLAGELASAPTPRSKE
ncbi:MAG: MerR family transcriptional regulator [Planctomycetota bacterium]